MEPGDVTFELQEKPEVPTEIEYQPEPLELDEIEKELERRRQEHGKNNQ